MLLVGVIGCIFYYFFCSSCHIGSADNSSQKNTPATTSVTPSPAQELTPTPTNNAFALNDDVGDFSLTANEHFNFNSNNFSILKPVSTNLDSKIDELKNYLNNHPEKELNIIGLYTSKEENPSGYPNLGIARANAIKNYLIGKGAASKQLNALGKLDDSLIPNGSIYQGPADYNFLTAKSIEDEEAKLKAEAIELKNQILSDPLQLNFETGSSKLSLSASQRSKIAKLSRYLDKATNGQINVIGHTDNTGKLEANMALGLARAEYIKKYLARNGININKINTSSQGPKKPIDTNETPEGRTKNRRVEVTLN